MSGDLKAKLEANNSHCMRCYEITPTWEITWGIFNVPMVFCGGFPVIRTFEIGSLGLKIPARAWVSSHWPPGLHVSATNSVRRVVLRTASREVVISSMCCLSETFCAAGETASNLKPVPSCNHKHVAPGGA